MKSFQSRGWIFPLAVLAVAAGTSAQTSSTLPVKPGLWETQSSVTSAVSMPPEMEARIAAMPPAQQAMVRQRMGGGASHPTTSSSRSCLAPNSSLDSMLKRDEADNQLKCVYNNRQQSSNGVSFDAVCTGPQMSGKGHVAFTFVDAEHVTGKVHMEMSGSQSGQMTSATSDNVLTSKFVSADCGDVKPQ